MMCRNTCYLYSITTPDRFFVPCGWLHTLIVPCLMRPFQPCSALQALSSRLLVPHCHVALSEKRAYLFLCLAGIDQTRGWFYTLMVLSTALFDKPAFKSLVCNGLVLAEDGKKMSKRLKNYPVSCKASGGITQSADPFCRPV